MLGKMNFPCILRIFNKRDVYFREFELLNYYDFIMVENIDWVLAEQLGIVDRLIYVPYIHDYNQFLDDKLEKSVLGRVDSCYLPYFSDTNIDRKEFLQPIYKCVTRTEMYNEMRRHKYTLIIGGYVEDTFRLHEAIYCGSLPIFIGFNQVFIDKALGYYGIDKTYLVNLD